MSAVILKIQPKKQRVACQWVTLPDGRRVRVQTREEKGRSCAAELIRFFEDKGWEK